MDPNNCFVDINAGQGGTEAQDWTQMLLRMYLKYCDKKGYKVELLEESDGEVAGLKSASLKVSGPYAYGYLRTETALANDSAEPLCPEPWIEAVITWTGVLCAERTNNMEQVGARKAEFADIIGDLIKRSNEDADTTGGGQPAPVAPVKG